MQGNGGVRSVSLDGRRRQTEGRPRPRRRQDRQSVLARQSSFFQPGDDIATHILERQEWGKVVTELGQSGARELLPTHCPSAVVARVLSDAWRDAQGHRPICPFGDYSQGSTFRAGSWAGPEAVGQQYQKPDRAAIWASIPLVTGPCRRIFAKATSKKILSPWVAIASTLISKVRGEAPWQFHPRQPMGSHSSPTDLRAGGMRIVEQPSSSVLEPATGRSTPVKA